MNYVRKLGFEETPDYDFLRELFSKVLKTLSEPEDGVFDWMLLNNGKGWEAGHVSILMSKLTRPFRGSKHTLQTPSTLLAQAHANASTPHTPHRSRDRDHGGAHRRSRQPLEQPGSPSSPLVLAPTPAHVKSSSRRDQGGSRGGSREQISVQPLPPTSRRASQQREARDRDTAGLQAPHPYAASPPNTGTTAGFRSNAYGRTSPVRPNSSTGNVQQLNGNGTGTTTVVGGTHNDTSESFLYGGQIQPGKSGNGVDAGMGGTPRGEQMNGARGMGMYDRDQMARVGEQDDDLPKKKGFWAALCCGR